MKVRCPQNINDREGREGSQAIHLELGYETFENGGREVSLSVSLHDSLAIHLKMGYDTFKGDGLSGEGEEKLFDKVHLLV